MAEILLPITPDDLPPIARGLVDPGLRTDPGQLATSIKNVLYPGWWTINLADVLPKNLYPFYRVICENPGQASIARVLQPEGARVEIVLPTELEPIKVERVHPLVRKLRSRYGTAANIISTAFGGMTLLTAEKLVIKGQEADSVIYTAVGVGLIVTSMVLTAIRSNIVPIPTKITIRHNQNNNPAVLN